jgi:hypothetical protein
VAIDHDLLLRLLIYLEWTRHFFHKDAGNGVADDDDGWS